MVKLLFGFPLHDSFDRALELFCSIKKFNNGSPVVFMSNQDIGYSVDRLLKLKSKRKYGWINMHNFLFDICENIKGMDFDYYVNLDSDCLFANYGFDKIFENNFDFNMDPDMTHWDIYNFKIFEIVARISDNISRFLNLERKSLTRYYTRDLSKNIKYYEDILQSLNLKRSDSRVIGCLGTSQIYSKRAVIFIAENIDRIENHPSFKKLVENELMIYETLFVNLLKDAGFIQTSTYPKHLPCIRFIPNWAVNEIENVNTPKLAILYHPVKRDANDGFRKEIIERTKLKQFIKILQK